MRYQYTKEVKFTQRMMVNNSTNINKTKTQATLNTRQRKKEKKKLRQQKLTLTFFLTLHKLLPLQTIYP